MHIGVLEVFKHTVVCCPPQNSKLYGHSFIHTVQVVLYSINSQGRIKLQTAIRITDYRFYNRSYRKSGQNRKHIYRLLEIDLCMIEYSIYWAT